MPSFIEILLVLHNIFIYLLYVRKVRPQDVLKPLKC